MSLDKKDGVVVDSKLTPAIVFKKVRLLVMGFSDNSSLSVSVIFNANLGCPLASSLAIVHC